MYSQAFPRGQAALLVLQRTSKRCAWNQQSMCTCSSCSTT